MSTALPFNPLADSVIIITTKTTTTGCDQSQWVQSPEYYRQSPFPQPILYISPLHPERVSNWDELQMGEGIQRQILDDVEQKVIPNSPLNPGGDSAIRKLL